MECKDGNLVTHIATGPHNWLNFELTDEDDVNLFRRGAEAAGAFVQGFNRTKYNKLRDGLFPVFKATREGATRARSSDAHQRPRPHFQSTDGPLG